MPCRPQGWPRLDASNPTSCGFLRGIGNKGKLANVPQKGAEKAGFFFFDRAAMRVSFAKKVTFHIFLERDLMNVMTWDDFYFWGPSK